jgi:aspartyl-tRNA(Asn)/glutamyl-tRNA(Gln) amidotransferase subunit B
MTTRFEPVIGLEVHVQLRTREKLFCSNLTSFGAQPNTNVCPVCLGLPGALPVLNAEAVRLAARTALALECRVHARSVFARKNYFYPDLPKGYQISQLDHPLATDGRFAAPAAPGALEESEVPIRINRIHMEEDAGKSIHDRFEGKTAVDLNRAGTPLVEIVTEPDFRGPAQVRGFLQRLKQLLEYLDVSDCNMEEGSLRVDANVSIRPEGSTELGTKTEVKNLNSFSGVEKAIETEIRRQADVLEAGGRVVQETLLWDEARGQVRSMRSKEESHDYRYFPDPDLPPLVLERDEIETLQGDLPELPAARRSRFVSDHRLPDYDAGVLTASRATADYFEAVVDSGVSPKAASNWVMGPVLRAAKERGVEMDAFGVRAPSLAELIELVDTGTLSRNMGRTVLERMLESDRSAAEVVEREGLAQVSGQDQLAAWVDEVLTAHPEEATRYRDGETRLLGFFMGQVMKKSGGKADAQRLREILARALAGGSPPGRPRPERSPRSDGTGSARRASGRTRRSFRADARVRDAPDRPSRLAAPSSPASG